MARGGFRPGAGRPKKGERRSNKASGQAEQRPDAPVQPTEARTPLEFMLAVMNDPAQEANRRDRMAIAAAPFVHPKAAEQGKKEEREEAAKRASKGKFAIAAPPKAVTVN